MSSDPARGRAGWVPWSLGQGYAASTDEYLRACVSSPCVFVLMVESDSRQTGALAGRIPRVESRLIRADGDVRLHVSTCGAGPDVVVLSGGPGCVHYLADETLAPQGFRAWFPDPRGVGCSEGGPHDMVQAVLDLDTIRRALGIDAWMVLGHSWGSDLAVRYALEHPARVKAVIGIAGHGLHRDRNGPKPTKRASRVNRRPRSTSCRTCTLPCGRPFPTGSTTAPSGETWLTRPSPCASSAPATTFVRAGR